MNSTVYNHMRSQFVLIFLLIFLNPFSILALDQKPLNTEVRLQLKWKHQFQFAGFYAAIEKGYYNDVGLNVQLIEADSQEDPRLAVFNGKADFGIATSDIIFLRDKKMDAVVLAAIFQHSPEIFISSSKSGIRQISQLKGKTISMEEDNSEMLAFLLQGGITAEQYRQYPRSYGIEELVSGEADVISGYLTDEPFELRKVGFDFSVLSPRSSGIDFYGDVLFTSEEMISKNPRIVHKFRMASLKGWKYAMKNQKEIIELIYQKYTNRHTIEHLSFEAREMNQLVMADVVEIGYSNPDKWNAIAETYKKLGLINKDYSNKGLLYEEYDSVINDIPWQLIIVFISILIFISGVSAFFYFTSRRLKMEVLQRRKMEVALSESEALYRSVLNALPDTAVITDLDGTILLASPVITSMFGYTAQEVVGHPLTEFIDPTDHQKVMDEIGNMFKGDMRGVDEYTGVRSDGSIITIEVNGDFIRNSEDQPIKMVFVARDISDRKQAEERLVKSEETYRRFVETINDAIYEVSNDGTIIYVSPAIERIVGYKPDELLGKNFFAFMYPDDRPILMEALQSLGQTDFSHLEYRYITKTGDVCWVRSSTRAVYQNGVMVGGNGSLTNVNDRKLAELEILKLNNTLELKIEERTAQLEETNRMLVLENSERVLAQENLISKTTELENFFNVALDLLCIAGIDGKFIKVNKAWESILGFSSEDLEKRNFLEFIHPEDMQQTLDAMQQLSEKNPILNFVNRYQTKDGDYRFIEWRSRPVGNQIYAAARDITERKRAMDFERELLQFSPKIAGIRQAEIPQVMNLSLERIGKFLAADRSYIYEFDFDNQTMSKTHEWCEDESYSRINKRQNIPLADFPLITELILSNENYVVESTDLLSDDRWKEREKLQADGIKSTICIPLSIENQVIGFVRLDSIHTRKEFIEAEINILKVWSGMLSSLINSQRAENLLEQTRQNYETFFNTIDDFLFVFDENGNIVDTNNTVIERLGFSLDELKNQSVMMVRPKEYWEEAATTISDLLTGKLAYCTIPLISKSGKQIPVETRVKKGYWNGKNVIFGVSKDISQIKISEQKFSLAFQSNSAMMAISLFDKGDYLDVNNFFLEILGFSRDEIIGKTNRQLGLFPDPNLRNQILDSLNDNIPVRKLEILMRTKDGTIKIGLLSADSIMVGGQRCLITTTMDITDRKKVEDELRKARQEAELANVAKSEFLSRMSHELRTPMNAILGFAQLLEMSDLNTSQLKGVNHILHSGKHLLNLINEVLDISRIESGRLSLSLEPVNLGSVVAEMLEIIKPLMQARGLKYKHGVNFRPELFVKTDRQRLKQVLLNLLNNAIKYNRDGGLISVDTLVRKDETTEIEWIRIEIIDTGMGIEKENIQKLFNPFERIGAEMTSTEGTGLGLAVVKKLVNAMGGFVGVESVWGEGSNFWIELPLIESQLITAEKDLGLANIEPMLSSKTGVVLYIEDNASNIELVEQILKSQRANVELYTETHGRKAVELAIQFNPSLILLDLNLPDIHGSEVLTQLQANKKTTEIPVVVISADAMPQQLNKLLKAGAKNYLTKPLDIMQFLNIIDEYIHD